jgi:hypothetical protein
MSEGISPQNINRDVNCSLRIFCLFFSLILFILMCVCENTVKYTREESEVYGGNTELRAICDMYKMSVGVNFIPESKMTPIPNTEFGQAVTEGDISLQFNGNGHADILLPVEEEEEEEERLFPQTAAPLRE